MVVWPCSIVQKVMSRTGLARTKLGGTKCRSTCMLVFLWLHFDQLILPFSLLGFRGLFISASDCANCEWLAFVASPCGYLVLNEPAINTDISYPKSSRNLPKIYSKHLPLLRTPIRGPKGVWNSFGFFTYSLVLFICEISVLEKQSEHFPETQIYFKSCEEWCILSNSINNSGIYFAYWHWRVHKPSWHQAGSCPWYPGTRWRVTDPWCIAT